MAIGESAGFLLRIKANSDQAEAELKKFKNELDGIEKAAKNSLGPLETLGSNAGLSAQQFDNLRVGVGAAVAGIGAIVGVAAAAAGALTAIGVTLFTMARNASDAGSEIFDLQQKTGLAAATLSTLKLNADQSGSSLEGLSTGVTKFARLMGEANAGNEKAAATLKELGVTSTDLDTALSQAFKTINSGTEGVQQIRLATEAFGKSGADLIPVIKAMDGDMAGATEAARRLGVVLTEQDIRAADAFGDTLDTVSAQARTSANVFALQFAPVITAVMNDISRALAANQNDVRRWGENLGFFLNGLRVLSQTSTASSLASFSRWAIGMWQTIDPVANLLARTIGYIKQLGAANATATASIGGDIGPLAYTPPPIPRIGGGGGGRAPRPQTIGRADSQGDADADFLRNLQRRHAQEIALEQAKNERLAALDEGYYQEGLATDEQYLELRQKRELDFLVFKQVRLNAELAAVKGNADERARIENELAIIGQKIWTQTIVSENEVAELRRKHEKERQEAQAKTDAANEKEQKDLEKKLKTLGQITGEKARQGAEDEAKEAARAERERLQGVLNTTVGSGYEISAIGQLQNYFASEGNTAAIAGIEALSGAFSQLGQAVGQVVQAWVLYGNAGTSVRKVTAQILASIAQQAAIKAIFELAEGFAALALAFFGVPNAGPSATAHFTAAAIYGGIAGVAAVAGRAVAGDSFKQQTASATGGAGSSAGGSRNIDGQGQNYSSREDRTLAGSRNAPARSEKRIVLAIDGPAFLKFLQNDYDNNGTMREIVVGG